MDLNNLLKTQLKNDLEKELIQYFENKTDENVINLINPINQLIHKYTENISFKEDNKIKNKKNQCCARIWKNHMGLRCSNAIKNDDYCLKHYNQIQKKGYLPFKRYDEERPNYNEKGNKLFWYDYSEYEMIEIIIKYQNYSLLELIK